MVMSLSDSRGKCVHHRNIQLQTRVINPISKEPAWLVLYNRCPKCLENDSYNKSCYYIDNKKCLPISPTTGHGDDNLRVSFTSPESKEMIAHVPHIERQLPGQSKRTHERGLSLEARDKKKYRHSTQIDKSSDRSFAPNPYVHPLEKNEEISSKEEKMRFDAHLRSSSRKSKNWRKSFRVLRLRMSCRRVTNCKKDLHQCGESIPVTRENKVSSRSLMSGHMKELDRGGKTLDFRPSSFV